MRGAFNPRSWNFRQPGWLIPFSRLGSRLEKAIFRWAGQDMAIEATRHVLAREVERHGNDNPAAVHRMLVLAEQLREAGEVDESIVLLRQAVDLRARALGPEDIQTAHAESKLAQSLRVAAQHEEAVILKQHAIEVFTRTYGPDNRWVLADTGALAGSLARLKRFDEVEDVLDGLIPTMEKVLGPGNRWAISCAATLALAQANRRAFGPAIELQRQVVEMSEAALGHDDPKTQGMRLQLAAFLNWSGEDAEARLLAVSVLKTMTRLGIADITTSYARTLVARIDEN
jgi:Tetratricopeptide repeat